MHETLSTMMAGRVFLFCKLEFTNIERSYYHVEIV